MFRSVAVSKAAAAINNINDSKCSISTVCQLPSLLGLMVELCLSFRNSKLIIKQSSSSLCTPATWTAANNKLCTPTPPLETQKHHMWPIPQFLASF